MFHRRLFVLLATAILLVAALLRLSALHLYPPGPHYDEAVYFIVSRNIAFGGARFFPMVEAYQGREVLYMYLNTPFLQWIHDDIFTLRLVSAFCNLITVAATIALGRLMFRGRRGWIVGLTIGALLALSFPQIWLARQAFRAVTLPFMQAITLAALWRGLTIRRRAWLWLLVAGGLAGATVYTYNSSRLFPLWLGIAGIALLLFDRAHWRGRLRDGALFFGALLITAAPMALYAAQRPDVFFGRLAEVTQADQSVTLLESIWLHAKMFFIDGDPYLRYNIPHRPYFTLPEGLLLLVGMGVAARRLARRGDPLERVAYLLALLSPLMVIPSVISVGGLPPSHMRSLGMIPLIFVLVAVGFEWGYTRLLARIGTSTASGERLAPRPKFGLERDQSRPYNDGMGQWFAFTLIAVLVIGGAFVGQAYFAWAARADVFYETDADLAAAAKWLVEHHAGEIVYIAARDKGHPTAQIEPLPPVTWLGTDLLFRPPSGQAGLYLFPRSAPPPDEWRAWLEPGRVTDLPLAPDGRAAFEAFRLSGDTPLPDFISAQAANPYLRLVGMTATDIPAGGTGTLQMAWQVIAPPPYADFTPLVQLEDDLGSVLARAEPYMTLTDTWRPGETLIQRVEIAVPPATPPGNYHARVAWVGRASDQYVAYDAGMWAEIGALRVTRPAELPSSIETLIKHSFQISSNFYFLGYNISSYTYRPGEVLPVTFYWQASEDGEHPVRLTARVDSTPLDHWTPFAGYQWVEGEILAERRHLLLPRDLPAAEYTVTLNHEPIFTIHVAGIPREFTVPPLTHEVHAQFGDQLELVGYTLRRDDTMLFIEISWRSLNIMHNNYKFFIHALNEAGTIIEQVDTIPRQNTYPTHLWAEGEVVTEIYHIPLSAELRALRVGVYDAETLVRLPLSPVTEPADYLDFPLGDP